MGPGEEPAKAALPAQPAQAPAAKPAAPVGAKPEEDRGICVAITQTGKPTRLTGNSPSSFMECLDTSTLAWVNFQVDDLAKDGELVATLLGFSGSLVGILLKHDTDAYEDLETELGLRLPVIKVENLQVSVLPLLVLVRRGLVLTIHEAGKVTRIARFAKYADTFMRKIPADAAWNDKLTIVLTRLINENNERNFDGLRTIEDEGDKIGESLVDPGTDRRQLGLRIYEMKHALIVYLNALWGSLDVIQSLRYGDAEVISDDETLLARVGILADDVTRHIQLSEHMSEVLASGLEVVQSIYNNQLQILNNRLALLVGWLTLLGTAVLVPNTLGTILANPAYNLTPRDAGWYTALIVASTVLSTGAAWWWVRKSGWLPPKVE
ncbi:MAG TPA: CorA family divalent cation transporter [Candidatus Thermoplasmatota archaeon]|jgi:magnesium transporter|nr:CorA family divalent cation transporter [Candidatus Thermoplasmatota archaeon]